jgi:hypothetical protein
VLAIAWSAFKEEDSPMTKSRVPGRGRVRCLSLAAAALLTLSAAPGQRAEALSLINPGAAPTAKYTSDGFVTEVRGGHGRGGGGYHGGGGGRFHGGGFHGARFHAGPAFHGSRFHRGGFAFRHHRFHHRRFFYAPSYYAHPYCRVIWTYHGPRRICHYRHWRHHYRHHRYW